MATEQLTGAEWLARSLAANGTTHVFFIDAVIRRTLIELGTLNVQRVLGHSEKAVAYMADGYARVAGRPGICFAQSVGAANLASGLQDPFLGYSPVIAITGRKPPAHQHRNAYQEIPHHPMFSTVTKFTAEVDAASDLPRLLRQAWRAAMTGTPRPVHLDINGLQGDIIETGAVAEPAGIDPAFQLRMPPFRATPADDELERAAAALRGSKRLAIVAGAGVTASQAGPELLALGRALAAPIGTSLGGRGTIPTRDRLSIGCVGNYGAPPANQIVHEADMVLFVGCHTGDQVTHTWRIPTLDTPCVQIDVDPLELGRSYANTVGLVGDPKATLAKLLTALGQPARDTAFADRAAGIVATWREAREPLLAQNSMPIYPDRLCAEITRALAGGRHPGRGHRLFRHLDLHVDRTEWHNAELPTGGRVARLVIPGGAGGEMRGAGAESDLLVGRRRDLLSSDRIGNGAAARHRGRAGDQQQLRIRPGLAEHPAPARQQTRRRTRAGALRPDQLRRRGPRVRPARHPGGATVADRPGVARTRWHRTRRWWSMSPPTSTAARRSLGCRRE